MGFRFRKSIKILPGLKINLTHKGISSASIGKPGASLNIGKKGTRTSVGIPGTGLSYSKHQPYKEQSWQPRESCSGTTTALYITYRATQIECLDLGNFWIILFYCRGNSFLNLAILCTHNIHC